MQGTGRMRTGQTVLITAAAGATGHIGVQLAVLAGCTVIATCGGPKKSAALRKLGVHHIIDYKSQVNQQLPLRMPLRMAAFYPPSLQ